MQAKLALGGTSIQALERFSLMPTGKAVKHIPFVRTNRFVRKTGGHLKYSRLKQFLSQTLSKLFN